ncbi:MAG: hypothetical protein HOE90_14655 [Bacteriovoracaceae bacterium]|nr:hypothetical protein [Bacteriovoracaceae bacterium]
MKMLLLVTSMIAWGAVHASQVEEKQQVDKPDLSIDLAEITVEGSSEKDLLSKCQLNLTALNFEDKLSVATCKKQSDLSEMVEISGSEDFSKCVGQKREAKTDDWEIIYFCYFTMNQDNKVSFTK